jgi:RNA polymerase sigma-70 factor, ECF subfamily
MSTSPPSGLPPEDPLQLALRLRQGDEAALAAVLRTLGPKVAGGLKKRHPALAAEDVEDVLSVASLRLWQSRAQYRPEKGSLAAWFFIIADNVARDLLRKEARRPETPADVDQLPAADRRDREGPAFPPGLSDLLLRLPDVDHRILSTYAQAGGDGPWAADLAEELGLRAGTIRVRCRRIKEKLRKEMQALQVVAAAY